MPITDIWAKTFQICWVTNDIEQAMDQLKVKFDIPDFMIMRDIPLIESVYEGIPNEDGGMMIALANCGKFNLELVEPKSGFLEDFYSEKLDKGRFDMFFHHMSVRFDDDLDGYLQAVEALKEKGIKQRWASGIKDLTKFSYFDLREFLGHQLELIYFNSESLKLMDSF